MAFVSSLLSICPRVRKSKGRLIAATSWRVRILSLGLVFHKVTVDPKARELSILRRRLWFFPRRRHIRFTNVVAITYGYQDWAINSAWSWAWDTVDVYSVGLRLHGGEELRLFYFFGDGTFINEGPFPDWYYWEEYLCDLSGTQTKESRGYVELLSKMIGVPIEPPRW